MKPIKLSAILSIILLLGACSTYSVDTTRTAFYQQDFQTTGNIFVTAADDLPENSLELASYQEKVATKLSAAGYQITKQKNNAQYIATIDYEIDEGETYIVTAPVIRTHSRLLRRGKFARLHHRDRHKKINSPSSNLVTEYNRILALDITTTNEGKKVYESQVSSIGKCQVMAGVFDQLLTAMFTNFPGENGQIKQADIPYQGECDE